MIESPVRLGKTKYLRTIPLAVRTKNRPAPTKVKIAPGSFPMRAKARPAKRAVTATERRDSDRSRYCATMGNSTDVSMMFIAGRKIVKGFLGR